tara:strand:- start:13332 stop:13631 length:300 start_codon:yes stop_codon:yes gene_type:complete
MILMEKPDEVSEEDFNRLYNESHIPALLGVPGVHGAKRYKVNKVDGDLDVPTYCAIYEVDSAETRSSEAWQAAIRTGEWAEKVRPHLGRRSSITLDPID